MAPELETPPAKPVTPPVETPTDEPLSAHIDAFHAPIEEPTGEPAPEKKKHRSAKNFARPEDVPRIRALTTERDEWKAKYEAALAAQQAPPAPKVEAPKVESPAPVAAKPEIPAFTEKEPTLEQFQDQADPWSAYQRALARYDRRKDDYEASVAAKQASEQQTAKQQSEAEAKRFQEEIAAYQGHLTAYLQQHPDHAKAFENVPQVLVDVPLIAAALLRSGDKGPAFVYHLQQQPELLSELHLLTDGKPVSEGHVASVTRWLQTRVQGGSTGAPAPVVPPVTPAPRPPTPVRTTPMPPAADPPGEHASLRDHAKFFHGRR